jgi:hypothetical protein
MKLLRKVALQQSYRVPLLHDCLWGSARTGSPPIEVFDA